MKSVFITGSGQCGETFVLNLFSKNNKILAKDESRPFLHSYYKFLKFNKLNVDDAPLLNQIGNSIKKTNSKGKIYLESSSFLALHTSDINKKFTLGYGQYESHYSAPIYAPSILNLVLIS